MQPTEQKHAEEIKELYPEHYELYKNRTKWELITIIKAKDDLIELRKKIDRGLNKLYKNRTKWELMTIIKAKDDLIELRKKIDRGLNKL